MSGSFSRRAASRIHIAVFGSTGPIDRYSAMPSMNHSGIAIAPPAPEFALVLVMSYWKAWTSSWPSTWSVDVDRPGERQHDAALGGFGDAARAFAELPFDRVRLPEVRAAGVEDERLAAAELVIRAARQARIPALGHPRRHAAPPLPLPGSK